MAVGNQEVITCRPADLLSDELDKLRGEAEGLAKSDEDVLTYAMFPDIGRTFLQERAAGTLKPGTPVAAGSPEQASLPRRLRRPASSTSPCTARPTTSASTAPATAARPSAPSSCTSTASPRKCWSKPWTRLRSHPAAATRPRKAAGKKAIAAAASTPRPPTPATSPPPCPAPSSTCRSSIGEKVKAGDGVLVIEAMKMENEVQAPIAGTVISVHVAKGDAVTPDQVLVEIQPE